MLPLAILNTVEHAAALVEVGLCLGGNDDCFRAVLDAYVREQLWDLDNINLSALAQRYGLVVGWLHIVDSNLLSPWVVVHTNESDMARLRADADRVAPADLVGTSVHYHFGPYFVIEANPPPRCSGST